MGKRKHAEQGGGPAKKPAVAKTNSPNEAVANSDDEKKEQLQQQKEITFGKKLAHADKATRDKGVKKLKAWLGRQANLSDLDNRKIWKGLFYCMWMSDKPLVQEELAENLSDLVLALPSEDASLRFIRAFFDVMGKEWHGIDRLRLDKFYMLVRKFLNKVFALVAKLGWNTSNIDKLVGILAEGPLQPNSEYPKGLLWYICEQYVPMLVPVVKDDDSFLSDHLNLLLEPFCNLIAAEGEKVTQQKVVEGVFEPLVAKERELLHSMETDTDEENDDEPELDIEVDWSYLSEYIKGLAKRKDIEVENRSRLYALKRTLDDLQSELQEFLKHVNNDTTMEEGDDDEEDEEDEDAVEEEGNEDEEDEKENGEGEDEESITDMDGHDVTTSDDDVWKPDHEEGDENEDEEIDYEVEDDDNEDDSEIEDDEEFELMEDEDGDVSEDEDANEVEDEYDEEEEMNEEEEEAMEAQVQAALQKLLEVKPKKGSQKKATPAKPTPQAAKPQTPQASAPAKPAPSTNPKQQKAPASTAPKPPATAPPANAQKSKQDTAQAKPATQQQKQNGSPKAPQQQQSAQGTPNQKPQQKQPSSAPVKGAAQTPATTKGPVKKAPGTEPPPSKKKVQIVLQNNMVKEFNKHHRIARPNAQPIFDPTKQPSSSALKKVSAYEGKTTAQPRRKTPSSTPVKHAGFK
eukprot:comp19517_c0_seq1/m.22812 comp19517_c0_seq1/g.22812  ORF comp19517_c0_seq1/g.22812 comp19517_c0_seq1/m.22812 type:complete len:686 (-) comp19517_c0_seq1:114-2171(-)